MSEELDDQTERLPVTREFIGYGPSAWLMAVCFFAVLALVAFESARAVSAPLHETLPAVATVGVVTFLFGIGYGLLWSGLGRDVDERREVLNAER